MDSTDWPIAFLKSLETALPPPSGCHYCLMVMQYGSDEDGWEDRLALHMRVGEEMQTLFLDDQDMQKPCAALVDEVIKIVGGK